VAIGNPLGFERSTSLGVVSALYRDLPTGDGNILEGLIQTGRGVNPATPEARCSMPKGAWWASPP